MKAVRIKNIQGWFVGKGPHGWGLFLYTIALLIIPSCSTPQRKIQVPKANLSTVDSDLLVIVGTNDFHGGLLSVEKKTSDDRTYHVGGVATFASHVKILRRKFGENLLLLDAGDQWQGTLDSNLEEGAPMVEFFNRIGLDAAAVGNHEFDFGPVGNDLSSADPLGVFKARLSEAKFPYLSANLEDAKTKKLYEAPNLYSSVLIRKAGIPIGIVGLTTVHAATSTRSQFVQGIRFGDLRKAALDEVAELKKQGAKVIILAAHAGLVCKDHRGNIQDTTFGVWDKKSPQGTCEHSAKSSWGAPSDGMTAMIQSFPKKTFDAILVGHSHQIVHHWINDIPVLQAGAAGLYYNLLYLHIDRATQKIIPELTQIEGPVPICPKVFANQNDCNSKEIASKEGRGDLIPYELFGTPVYEDPETLAFLEQVTKKTSEPKQKVVAEAAETFPHTRLEESALAKLAADALREETGADFAIVNPGGIRAPLKKGKILYEDVFRSFPFDNFVSRLTVTGRELKNILKVASNGSRGVFGLSGLKMKAIAADQPAKEIKDFNGNGKIEFWEASRLLSVTDEKGKPLQDSKKYLLATLDFLVLGGDDLAWPMSKIPSSRTTLDAAGLYRDVIAAYLEKRRTVSPTDNTYQQPRIIFSKSR